MKMSDKQRGIWILAGSVTVMVGATVLAEHFLRLGPGESDPHFWLGMLGIALAAASCYGIFIAVLLFIE